MSVPRLVGIAALCTVVGNYPLEVNQEICGKYVMSFLSLRDPGLTWSLVECLKTIASYNFVQTYAMGARLVWSQPLQYG